MSEYFSNVVDELDFLYDLAVLIPVGIIIFIVLFLIAMIFNPFIWQDIINARWIDKEIEEEEKEVETDNHEIVLQYIRDKYGYTKDEDLFNHKLTSDDIDELKNLLL